MMTWIKCTDRMPPDMEMEKWEAKWEYIENAKKKDLYDEAVILCGKCGEHQKIFLTKATGFVEELEFECCSCGSRNILSAH